MTGGWVDLHMHSFYSDDGEFSPEELAGKCRDAGIKLMAIADHNCVRANAKARRAAEVLGITCISAVEIDCTFRGVNFHVLGYGIPCETLDTNPAYLEGVSCEMPSGITGCLQGADDRMKDFREIEANIERQSLAASRRMLAATRKLGFDVSEEDMRELEKASFWKGRWTGEMFAEVLLGKPEYADHPLLKPYRPGGRRSDNPYVNFYWDFYSQGKPCYAEVKYPGLEQVVELIHRNGGRAVLAHPGVNLRGHGELLAPIMDVGMDGIEAFSSYHSEEQRRYYYEEACRRNCMVTCGSDYHGKTKPSIGLGGHDCPEEVMDKIFRKLQSMI